MILHPLAAKPKYRLRPEIRARKIPFFCGAEQLQSSVSSVRNRAEFIPGISVLR